MSFYFPFHSHTRPLKIEHRVVLPEKDIDTQREIKYSQAVATENAWSSSYIGSEDAGPQGSGTGSSLQDRAVL
jgi:hypothetical protein